MSLDAEGMGAGMQIGYCGLDNQSLGAGPDAASLDITDYCAGYVSWDLLMVFIQVMGCSPCAVSIISWRI